MFVLLLNYWVEGVVVILICINNKKREQFFYLLGKVDGGQASTEERVPIIPRWSHKRSNFPFPIGIK